MYGFTLFFFLSGSSSKLFVCTGVAGVHEKQAVPMHADGSLREQYLPSTPKLRRASRRVPGWRDPRKILFAFAAL